MDMSDNGQCSALTPTFAEV